jgi:hypothetical protein
VSAGHEPLYVALLVPFARLFFFDRSTVSVIWFQTKQTIIHSLKRRCSIPSSGPIHLNSVPQQATQVSSLKQHKTNNKEPTEKQKEHNHQSTEQEQNIPKNIPKNSSQSK